VWWLITIMGMAIIMALTTTPMTTMRSSSNKNNGENQIMIAAPYHYRQGAAFMYQEGTNNHSIT
jgi:hypothetical protein